LALEPQHPTCAARDRKRTWVPPIGSPSQMVERSRRRYRAPVRTAQPGQASVRPQIVPEPFPEASTVARCLFAPTAGPMPPVKKGPPPHVLVPPPGRTPVVSPPSPSPPAHRDRPKTRKVLPSEPSPSPASVKFFAAHTLDPCRPSRTAPNVVELRWWRPRWRPSRKRPPFHMQRASPSLLAVPRSLKTRRILSPPQPGTVAARQETAPQRCGSKPGRQTAGCRPVPDRPPSQAHGAGPSSRAFPKPDRSKLSGPQHWDLCRPVQKAAPCLVGPPPPGGEPLVADCVVEPFPEILTVKEKFLAPSLGTVLPVRRWLTCWGAENGNRGGAPSDPLP